MAIKNRKIKISNPIVNLQGDEMTRVLWQWIKEDLILPWLDIELMEYDLGLPSRDASEDAITQQAAQAVRRYGVGVKCATITPDRTRLEEFKLKKIWPSPNATIRNALMGTIFREPIIFNNIPRIIRNWNEPIIIARHAFADQYRSCEIALPAKGHVTLTFTNEDGSTTFQRSLPPIEGAGVALAMYNEDASIEHFARSCLRYALMRDMPLYFSTKNTILKIYDQRFKDIFDRIFEKEFATDYAKKGLTYQHRLIDDMAASVLKWQGGFVWACKNYDGDVQSDSIAQGFGSLGLMTSVLISTDAKTVLTEAAHGTVTSHFRQHQKKQETSTNPIACIFAWSQALSWRARFDHHTELKNFADMLEQSCRDTVEGSIMTKDLALLVSPAQTWCTSREFLKAVAESLSRKMAKA